MLLVGDCTSKQAENIKDKSVLAMNVFNLNFCFQYWIKLGMSNHRQPMRYWCMGKDKANCTSKPLDFVKIMKNCKKTQAL